jgi:hypothetical protein
MKISILCGGHGDPHAGWVAIDELADLMAHYLGAELLAPVPVPRPWSARLMRRRGPCYRPLATAGGDVLIVVGRGPADLGLINAIPDCRRKFARIYAWVTDSYFQAGFGRETASYDAITVTAHEDAAFVRDKFGIKVHQLYQGADCLTWVPRRELHREIDVMGFGRTPPSYHAAFQRMFHVPASPHLYLHSPLGNITGGSVHLERGMLFKLLHRTRISLAFHLLVEPQGNRPRSMMVTSRWLESLLSGCIVAGKRPVSRMADEMLFWPGATVELADDPRQAGAELLDLLARNETLLAQRRSNIRHAILHHDWRDRIRAMCTLFELPVSAALVEDLSRLPELAAGFS